MQIAVASGKGGTGKTIIATSLALSLVGGQQDVLFIDCDVEAPNGHLFLKPEFSRQKEAVILIPQVNKSVCALCGKCVEVCQFHALAKIGKTIMVFQQLCHGCGSCSWNCPEEAISELANPIGMLEAGKTMEGIHFAHGVLTISEPMPTPVIRQLKRWEKFQESAVVILDAPPGASCSVVETLRRVDYVLLVTEPTPFGLHDLKQILGIVQDMGIPAGIVINRDGIGDNQLDEFLTTANLPILLRVPFSTTIASGNAAGRALLEILPEYRENFQVLFQKISHQVGEVVL